MRPVRLPLGAGPVVCLTAAPEEILRRVGTTGERPLLAEGSEADRLAKIRTLLEAREETYRLASHRIDTTGRSIDDVVGEIRSLVGAE